MTRAARFLAMTVIAAVTVLCLLYAGAFVGLLVLERFGAPTAQLISMN